jgi:hypothetical protein
MATDLWGAIRRFFGRGPEWDEDSRRHVLNVLRTRFEMALVQLSEAEKLKKHRLIEAAAAILDSRDSAAAGATNWGAPAPDNREFSGFLFRTTDQPSVQ